MQWSAFEHIIAVRYEFLPINKLAAACYLDLTTHEQKSQIQYQNWHYADVLTYMESYSPQWLLYDEELTIECTKEMCGLELSARIKCEHNASSDTGVIKVLQKMECWFYQGKL